MGWIRAVRDVRGWVLRCRARRRARALGFVPNEDLAELPMNRADATAKNPYGARYGDASTPIPTACSLTLQRLEQLRDTARELLDRSPEAADSLDSLELLPGVPARSRYPSYAPLRLADEDRLNDRLIAAVELAGGPEAAVDVESLGEELISYHPILPFILTNRSTQKLDPARPEDKFIALAALIQCPAIDRTGTLNNGLRMKIMEPIPPLDPTFSKSLEQVICDRCRSLLASYPRLHLLWSGGIDTTAMLVGFLKVASEDDWNSRLSVHYCARSLQEHPRFFQRFVKRLPHHLIPGHVRDFVDGSRYVVTGDPADMLFGTVFMSSAFAGRETEVGWGPTARTAPNPMFYALDGPWRKVAPAMLRVRSLLPPGRQAEADWLRWMEPQVAKSPIPIVSLFDWLWWITYSCKFQHDLMRVFYNRTQITPQLMDSVVNFYLSPDWHQWSFHNHAAKMQDKTVWASYKQPLKQFIRDFDGDCEYYAGKTKVVSCMNAFGHELGFDDHLNKICFGQLTSSGQRMKAKYGDELQRRFLL